MRRPIPILLLALLALLAAACSVTGPTGAPSAGGSPAGTESAPGTVAPSGAGSPVTSSPPASVASVTPVTQTDTAWGRIWDALPSGFPVPPGAAPAEPAEPVSAAFDLSAGAHEAATFMQDSLELAGFNTVSLSGPLEDGSFVLESIGAEGTDCRIETTLAPTGGLTRMTVRYGAGCPLG